MSKYDAVVILGSQPDPSNWLFPSHVYRSLDRAADLVWSGEAGLVLLSGRYAIRFDFLGITPPFNEADRMAEYLIAQGVEHSQILREVKSKDTISNLYFIKTEFLIPRQLRMLHFVCADFRLNRIAFLCERILSREYEVTLQGVRSERGEEYPNESHTFCVQREFLAPMLSGEHDWLAGRFYGDAFYERLKLTLMDRPPSDRWFS
jgi:hypothetical protein